MKVSRYNNYLFENDCLFIFNSCFNSAVCISDKRLIELALKWEPDSLIDEGLYDVSFVQAMCSQGILLDSNRNETDFVNYLYYKTLRSTTLNIILIVTRNCNFACPYCYEEHEEKQMNIEIMDGIISFIQSKIKEGYNTLEIGWFGGEPLIEFTKIISFMKKIQSAFPTLTIKGSMTTNGYLLTRERLNELCALSINRYQITIDGLENTHNKTRVLRNGLGTWKTIIGNLLSAKDTKLDFSIMLRTNFSEEMTAFSSEWINYIAQTFGDDSRFTFHFEAIKNLGKPSEYALFPEKNTSKLFQEMGETSLENDIPLPMINQTMVPMGMICYAANPHSFVIDYDGTIRKCTVALDDSKNTIGKIGNQGLLHFDAFNYSWWVNYDPYEECKTCSIYPICIGKKCPNGYLSHHGCETIKAAYVIGMKKYIKAYLKQKEDKR